MQPTLTKIVSSEKKLNDAYTFDFKVPVEYYSGMDKEFVTINVSYNLKGWYSQKEHPLWYIIDFSIEISNLG